MKVLLVNGNAGNEYIKYEIVSALEDKLDEAQKVICVKHISYKDNPETYFDDLVNAYEEDDFDLYVLTFYKEMEKQYFENSVKELNLSENDVIISNPHCIVTDVNDIIEFIS